MSMIRAARKPEVGPAVVPLWSGSVQDGHIVAAMSNRNPEVVARIREFILETRPG